MTDAMKARHERACRSIPGGVNSPVRAFRAVGGSPIFFERASGAHLWDADGRRYVDFVGSWGPMILGHSHPEVVEAVREQAARAMSFGAPCELETELAELVVAMVPSVEMVRFVNSGTEATMSAIRLARAATGREMVVKFEGCYHGHGDAFLAKGGSGLATLGIPASPGVPRGAASCTLDARFNDAASVAALFGAHPDAIAAVIVEPVVGNMGCVPPEPGFLAALRDLCTRAGAVLIFDEVMTGFRVAPGGAQELFGMRPDLTTLGKIVGGGLPVGAYGGGRDLMEIVAPAGPMYQAGTLSGNPLAMTAGLATLRHLRAHPDIYARLEKTGAALQEFLERDAAERGVPACVQRVGSMGTLFFGKGPIRNWDDAKLCDTKAYATWFHAMLGRGMYFPPAQFEAWFVGAAHEQ